FEVSAHRRLVSRKLKYFSRRIDRNDMTVVRVEAHYHRFLLKWADSPSFGEQARQKRIVRLNQTGDSCSIKKQQGRIEAKLNQSDPADRRSIRIADAIYAVQPEILVLIFSPVAADRQG